ncbi:alpha-amylase family glycosyl hydrolase [Hymenobacter taeanensis]|nr:alpha-amylase family glycosyl hydrolase [Hymenobacter taeanensis]
MPVLHAQIVTTQPTIFKDTDAVTLIYDANQGNKALAGYTGNVYIWTGVITNQSTSNTDWKHVKGTSFSAPIPEEKMTPLGNNKYSITFTPRTYYPGLTSSETILKLAMVFRGDGGKPEGKGDGNSDILVDVAQNTFDLRFTNPAGVGPFLFALNTPTPVSGTTAVAADLALFLNGTKVAEQANATSITANVTLTQAGNNTLRLTATKGATTEATEVVVQSRSAVTLAALPAGAKKDGVTYLNGGTSAIISLTAPNKQFVHVIGEFNNWTANDASYMKRTPNASGMADNSVDGRWWVQIDGLTPGQEYAYQFLIDGGLRVADPFSEKILTPTDDAYINASGYTVYPGLKAYPAAGANGNVSVLQSNAPGYTFQATNFQRPKREDMVVYELLPRDFIARHDYKTLIDTLAYMQRLGVNVIELMPVNEFEGNESWGYNVSFYFAPDKYYGPKNELKRFIDECHKRGIAVVLDMVLNQSFGQSPMVQMYFNNGKPSNNPWFNADATHPFNVGYDFNHESAFTRYFSKRVMEFWIKEYNIDGYRFDLSKGFTQKVTTDAGAWSQYDQSRVNIWKDYHDFLVSVDPNVYPILEHLGSNDEEKVLSDMGLMLWGVMTHNYNEATMGYINDSNFSYGYYGSTAQGGRGWSQPNLVTYMESHDEERLMYKNLTFGNSSGSYSVKNLPTALARQEMAAAFFFPVPGPKMIWQFGELGYDKSIFSCPDGTIPQPYANNGDCKLANKPALWNYYQDPNRRHLYDVYRSLIALKVQEPVFENPASFTQNLSGAVKTMQITDPRLNVTIVGNFDVQSATVVPNFQSAGTWYNYLTGEALVVTNPAAPLTLAPGQYAVYTSRKISVPKGTVLASKSQRDAAALQLVALPNPAGSTATLRYELGQSAPVSVTVTNLLGATVHAVNVSGRQAAGAHELQLPVQNLANGVYIVRLTTGAQQQSVRLLVQH